jgi:hypothetical protein
LHCTIAFSFARQLFPAALPGSLFRQPCPAALPGSLARQPGPAALPGSLARQPCPAALPGMHHCKKVNTLNRAARVRKLNENSSLYPDRKTDFYYIGIF